MHTKGLQKRVSLFGSTATHSLILPCVTCPDFNVPAAHPTSVAATCRSAEAAQDTAEVMNSGPWLLAWNLAVYSLTAQWWADFFDLSMPHL